MLNISSTFFLFCVLIVFRKVHSIWLYIVWEGAYVCLLLLFSYLGNHDFSFLNVYSYNFSVYAFINVLNLNSSSPILFSFVILPRFLILCIYVCVHIVVFMSLLHARADVIYRCMYLCAYMEARRGIKWSTSSLFSPFEGKSHPEPKAHSHLGGKAARLRNPPVSTPSQFAGPGICGVEACHVDACIRSQNFYDCTASAVNLCAIFIPNPAWLLNILWIIINLFDWFYLSLTWPTDFFIHIM